jgi:hypothetical protein
MLYFQIKLHEQIYGKSLLSKSSNVSSKIIESAGLLNVQQKKKEEAEAMMKKTEDVRQNQASNQSNSLTPMKVTLSHTHLIFNLIFLLVDEQTN